MASDQYLGPLLDGLVSDSNVRFSVDHPSGTDEMRAMVRALMNMRAPNPVRPELLAVQDAYLKERTVERGVVRLEDVPTVRESLGIDGPFSDTVCLWQGDITVLECDAIVNAASPQMLGCFQPGHLCIDNCIHTFAGMQLRLECSARMEALRAVHGREYQCPIATPMVTDAYNLPCGKVIHVAGPVVDGALTPELEDELRECYIRTLDACRDMGIRSVAFCCISTGAFRFPNRRAAEIAVGSVHGWLRENAGALDKVVFDVFLDEDMRIYQDVLSGSVR